MQGACQMAPETIRETTMGRLLGFLYGIVAYLVFFATFLYAIGFVAGIGVPKTIDSGPATPLSAALIIDILLMSVFAIQHSVMARPAFKRWLDQDHPARDRAQHLCAVGEPGAGFVALAVAADSGRDLAGQ